MPKIFAIAPKKARVAKCSASVILFAVLLVLAQFGIATHSLHLDGKRDGQKVELTCAFCLAGSHYAAAPSTPIVNVQRQTSEVVVAAVKDVCDVGFPITSRVTRGPPLSSI
jgi:hypothetical protein